MIAGDPAGSPARVIPLNFESQKQNGLRSEDRSRMCINISKVTVKIQMENSPEVLFDDQ